MESIGYIRGRIDEIADRSSRMEMRLNYAARARPSQGGPTISVSSGTPVNLPGSLPSKPPDDSTGRLLSAIIALIFAVAALLGTMHFTTQKPPITPNVVAVSPGGQ